MTASTVLLSFDMGAILRWIGRLRAVETDADKLRAALDRLKISQRELGRQLEIPERDLRHLFQGHAKVPRWLWLAIAQLEAQAKEKAPG
jgi:hypothetical protein